MSYYRPQRSCGQGYVFTRVCDSVHTGGGGVLQAGRTPRPGRHPPQLREPPRPSRHPPGPGRHPPGWENPPSDQADTPPQLREPPLGPGRTLPPGKQTSEYGLRAAGMHPTVMHSCYYCILKILKLVAKVGHSVFFAPCPIYESS